MAASGGSPLKAILFAFGEDFAALVGLVLAFVFVSVAGATGDPFYDALGSMCIGVLLIVVAVFVGVRVRALLIGRSGDPDIQAAIEEHIASETDIVRVFNVLTVQMGPQLMLAAKIHLREGMPIEKASACINRLEESLKARFPEIAWCFVEPDVED